MFKENLWFIYTLMASILWGIHYSTAGQLSKTIPPSLISVFYLVFVGIMAIAVMAFFYPSDFTLKQFIYYLNPIIIVQLIVIVLTGCISNFLVFNAIADSSATKTSIIEITYPFFVALFAIVLYGENELSFGTSIGGLLIFTGVIFVIRG